MNFVTVELRVSEITQKLVRADEKAHNEITRDALKRITDLTKLLVRVRQPDRDDQRLAILRECEDMEQYADIVERAYSA